MKLAFTIKAPAVLGSSSSPSSSSSSKLLNKRELEKAKKEEEEKAAAAAYEEFVRTFEQPTSSSAKMFVRGDVINPADGEERGTTQAGQLYNPAKLKELEKKTTPTAAHQRSSSPTNDEKPPKPVRKDKKKSNLELFKEELKQIQEEREERQRIKTVIKETGRIPEEVLKKPSVLLEPQSGGSFDTGDPTTTNIYLGNISPHTTEKDLMDLFGKYGPLASVKVMWPRSEEERLRNRNCGFVAFMCRKDGERAISKINGQMFLDYEMKLGWGKAVPIPPMPIYIPPKLRDLIAPPPPSGLPFSATPDKLDEDRVPKLGSNLSLISGKEKIELDEMIENSIVKVVIPTDRQLLLLINRMVEFVVNEGPMFEAIIMNREIHNPMFRFLFDNNSPAHVYYRWRLFSVLQGDSTSAWRTQDFRMFSGGPLWKPPLVNPFAKGMPLELISDDEEMPDGVADEDDTKSNCSNHSSRSSRDSHKRRDGDRRSLEKDDRRFRESKYEKKVSLTDSQRDKLEDMLRGLVPEKNKIADSMLYCMDHSEAAEEVVDCITESLSISETPLLKKIARLYLVSDILYNCASAKVSNASYFRKGFQARLEEIFKSLQETYRAIDGRLRAEQFRQRVVNVIRAWEDWTVYSPDFLVKLHNIFLGLSTSPKAAKNGTQDPRLTVTDEDLDGTPLPDDLPSSRSHPALLATKLGRENDDDDVDGVPLDLDLDIASPTPTTSITPRVKRSKWQ